MSRVSLLLAAATAAFPTIAHALQPLQPTEKWVVDFADAQCVASRNYGTREQPLILGFKAPPLGGVVQLVLLRKGRAAAPSQEKGSISIAGSDQSVRQSFLTFGAEKRGSRIYVANIPIADFENIKAASSISVRVVGHFEENFQLLQMTALTKTMEECVADLRTVWNVSGTSQTSVDAKDGDRLPNSRLSQPAVGALQSIFRPDDYPMDALIASDQGATKMALLINEEGRVADCSVIETSGAAALDSQSCAIVKDRARFQPAIGLDGKPAKDSVIQRVRWVMR